MTDARNPFDVISKPVTVPPPTEPSTRSRKRYRLIASWLGAAGVHNFYAGRTWQGALELVVFGTSAAVLAAVMFLHWGAGDQWPFFVAPLALGGLVGPGLVALVEKISVESDGQRRLFRP